MDNPHSNPKNIVPSPELIYDIADNVIGIDREKYTTPNTLTDTALNVDDTGQQTGAMALSPSSRIVPPTPPRLKTQPTFSSLSPTANPTPNNSTIILPQKTGLFTANQSIPDLDLSTLCIRETVICSKDNRIFLAAEKLEPDPSTDKSHGTTYYIFSWETLDPASQPQHRFQANLLRLTTSDIESHNDQPNPSLQLACTPDGRDLVVCVPSDEYTLVVSEGQMSGIWVVSDQHHISSGLLKVKCRFVAQKYFCPAINPSHLYITLIPKLPGWFGPYGSMMHIFDTKTCHLIQIVDVCGFTSSPNHLHDITWDESDCSVVLHSDTITTVRDTDTLRLRWFMSASRSGKFCAKQGRWAIMHKPASPASKKIHQAGAMHKAIKHHISKPGLEASFVVWDVISGLDLAKIPTPFLSDWDALTCRVCVTPKNANTLAKLTFSYLRPGSTVVFLTYDFDTSTWASGIDVPVPDETITPTAYPSTLITKETGETRHLTRNWTMNTVLDAYKPEPESNDATEDESNDANEDESSDANGDESPQNANALEKLELRPPFLQEISDIEATRYFQFHDALAQENRSRVADFVQRAVQERDDRFMTAIVPGLPKLLRAYPSIAQTIFDNIGFLRSRDDTYDLFTRQRLRDPQLRLGTETQRLEGNYIMWDGDDLHAFADRRKPWGILKHMEMLMNELEFRTNRMRRGLCVYPRKPNLWRYFLDRVYRYKYHQQWDPWVVVEEEGHTPYPHSVFAEIALDDRLSQLPIFNNPVMRPVLDFKWRNFARRRLYLIWILFLAYYITFWIACSWDEMPTTARINMLRSALVLAVILIWMELRQLIGEGWRYVLSIYNWFDLAACALPSATIMQILINGTGNSALLSFSVLALWLHFLLQLRVFRWMGILIEAISQILFALMGFWVVLVVVTFAFAHAIWLTLSSNKLFATNFSTTEQSTFSTLPSAYRSVWFFLTGNYASGLTQDPSEYSVLTLLFLITTSIVLMNVLIALMNDVVGKASISADNVWLRQRAKLIAEIEVYWMFEFERQDPSKFPRHIFFLIDDQIVRMYEESQSEQASKDVSRTMREENNKIAAMVDDKFKGLRTTVESMGSGTRGGIEGIGVTHPEMKRMQDCWSKVMEDNDHMRSEIEGLKKVLEELVGTVKELKESKGENEGVKI